jgi:predicted RNA-binding Zn-ribbon protein involved in translation (DUF1610 family)
MNKCKYTKELLAELVQGSISVCDVMRKLGLKLAGGNHSYIKRLIKKFELDTSHFKGYATHCGQESNNNKKHWTKVLVLREGDRRQESKRLRRALLESGRSYTCVFCGQGEIWNGKKLVLEIHHKNENWLDDRSDNLDFICPNCHSQE